MEGLRAGRDPPAAARVPRSSGGQPWETSPIAGPAVAAPVGMPGRVLEGRAELASLQVRPYAADAAGAVLRQLPEGAPDVGGQQLPDLLGPVYKEMAAAAQQRAVRSTPRPG